jgi:hypothetical protein
MILSSPRPLILRAAVIFMACALVLVCAPVSALAQGTDIDISVGPNRGAATPKSPATFFLYDDKGMRYEIIIDNLPAPNPFPMPGTDAWDAASKLKAEAIRDAVNAKLPGRATARPTLAFVPKSDGGKFDVVRQWEVHIDNVTGINTGPEDKKKIRGRLGETDAAKVTNRPASKMSLPIGSMGGDGVSAATGIDALGDPSVVQLGLLNEQLEIVGGDHLATVRPGTGMTDGDVLTALELQLDAMGIFATFDALLDDLTLDNPLPDGDSLVWTTTDTGLNLSADLGVAVSAPSTLLLVGSSLAALAGLGWHHHRVRRPTRHTAITR